MPLRPGVNAGPRRMLAWAAALAVVMIVAGCASRGGYYKDDGPPARPPMDIQSIPDATPRDEPLSRTGNDPYVALGQRYSPMRSVDAYKERGTASWYGKKFHGKRTSSGEPYDMYKMTAAHRTLPLPSYVRVTNLKNGESIIVRVNDRGPFLHDRLIDLSYAAAYKLGIVGRGTGRVEVEVVTAADSGTRVATAAPGPVASAPVQEASTDADRYFVQFGAFSRTANAQSMMRKLQQIGIGFAHIQHGDDGYFRVRSGPFSSSSTVERILMRGVDFGLNTTIVMEDSKP
ncbi:MAG: septal ring lytic transglycosylase RlpA family protein [Gammaproteobacteria bacterium]|nr:septal ring lytic transglycosylase RlpA family protein [Gammaproteobacteria bacterium]